MAESPRNIAHLIVNDGSGPKTAKVRLDGVVQRGLGIWPNVVNCFIAEDELAAAFPSSSLSKANVNIRIGTDTRSVLIEKWQVRDITPVDYGSTDGNSTVRAVTFRMRLEDARWKLHGERGGVLLTGLMNPTNAAGEFVTLHKRTNSELVQRCIDVIPLTFVGSIPSTLDDFDPPADLEWYGAHAPTELQRILEATRHAFCYHQDGTFSIVKLLDPGEIPDYPSIDPLYKTLDVANTVQPVTADKCIIASCPTRVLVQRKRTLEGDRPLVWVGIDTDGATKPLEELSWWPSGKTPIEVVRNAYRDVAQDARSLAEASIFKMLRLDAADLGTGWTFTNRIVDEFDLFEFESETTRQPFTCMLEARTAVEDEHGGWVNAASVAPIEGAHFNLETGVLSSPRLLVQIDSAREVSELEPHAFEITSALDLVFTFAHHPQGGVTPGSYSKWWDDYFMAAYEWDGAGGVQENENGIPAWLVQADEVPVIRHDYLQLYYIERDDGTFNVDPVNLDALKARAEKLAKQYLTAQAAQIEFIKYVEMHDVDPSGSVTEVTWDPSALSTIVRIRDHVRVRSPLHRLASLQRHAQGSVGGQVTKPQTRGMLSGRSAATGPASGARAVSRQSVAPGSGGGGSGGSTGSKGKRRVVREFPAEVEGSTRDGANWRWTYSLREWSKTGAGYGYERWNHPTGAVVVTGYNTFEYDNGEGGMLGIQVTVDELTACGQQLKPVETNTLVMVREVHVLNAGAPLTVEYWFSHPNGIEDVV